jgi:hypothetical protein
MAAERPCSIQPPSGRNGHTKGNAARGEQGLVTNNAAYHDEDEIHTGKHPCS